AVGGVLGFGLRGVGVAQGFGAGFGVAGGDSLALGGGGVAVVGNDAGVALAVGRAVAVRVAAGAADGELRHGLAAGGLRLSGGQKQQVRLLDGGDGVVAFAKAGEEVGVGFVGLVDVGDGARAEAGRDGRRELVAPGNGFDDGAERGVVVAVRARHGQGGAQVGAAPADVDLVRGAAVLDLVDNELADGGHTLALPAELDLH